MNKTNNPVNLNWGLFVLFAIVFGLAFWRVHMRVQSTLIGYELGKLKQQESKLLEERSHLQMTVAKITTKNHLNVMAQTKSPRNRKPLAVNH